MSTKLVSIETIEAIASQIIADYSLYMQNKIDVEQARTSVGYQLDKLRDYEYENKEYGCRSVCVLPRRCDLIDVSLLINSTLGFGRYILNIRHEGDRKYAVHANRFVLIDSDNPSKPFDVVAMEVVDVRRVTTTNLATTAGIVSKALKSLSSTNGSSTKSSIKIKNNIRIPNAFVVAVHTPPVRSSDKPTLNNTPPSPPLRTSPPRPAPRIACPTNNTHCCYANKHHSMTGKCTNAAMKCCIGESHYEVK